ncbi:MAG: class I fructose-bisphosphate aldolase [Proteobacteria bacterium]|nr:class I fructose-bisphosphate aldolase [Pseudomonadota bacterium]
MKITKTVKDILKYYESETIALKTNLARLLSHGALGGSGKIAVLAVDQGFEHGPDRVFAINPKAYDPHYIYDLATKYNLSGLAAPLGLLQAGADTYLAQVPLILKMNSNNLLMKKDASAPDQALTATIQDALNLGCSAIGFTIYPGSDMFLHQLEELKDLASQARQYGLVVMVWSYVRGHMPKEEETALDLISYGAHMACLMGAHIVKVKIPNEQLYMPDAAKNIINYNMPIHLLSDRIQHVMRASLNSRRIVIFSGGEKKDDESLYNEIKAIKSGGGYGSIIGRNIFQRSEEESAELISNIVRIYLDGQK